MEPTTRLGEVSRSHSLVDALKCISGVTKTVVGVLFGPLRLHPETDETAKNIFRLLNIFGILDSDIDKISVHPKSDYVRIDFKSEEMADFVITAVKEKSSLKRVYNFSRLSDTPVKLQAVKISEAPKDLTEVTKLFADTAQSVVTYSPVDEDVLCVVKSTRKRIPEAAPGTVPAEKLFQLMPLSLGVDSADITIPLDMPEIVMNLAQPSVCNNPAKKDESVTTTKLLHPFWHGPPFYLFHGRITRINNDLCVFNNSLKKKDFLLDKTLSDLAYLVSIAVTCFANRRDGGSLYIGVTDDGLVEGMHIPDVAVDRMKLEIDTSMTNFIRPMMLPYSYTCNYVKVIGNVGLAGKFATVIEVHVEGRSTRDVEYTFRGRRVIYDDNKKGFYLQQDDKVDRRRW